MPAMCAILSRIAGCPPVYIAFMAANSTLLCIHRDPAQLSSLKERGYDLVTASNGCEGLRLFMSQPVDAIVLEHHLGLLDGVTVASTLKQVRPEIPIVMLTDDLEFPDGALKSVDAIVTKSDGAHFLWATVHFVLNVKPAVPKPAVPNKARETTQPAPNLRLTSKSEKAHARPHKISEAEDDEKLRPFSPGVWKGIRNGSLRF
jgi:DNA-binding response OmpR family regulator